MQKRSKPKIKPFCISVLGHSSHRYQKLLTFQETAGVYLSWPLSQLEEENVDAALLLGKEDLKLVLQMYTVIRCLLFSKSELCGR